MQLFPSSFFCIGRSFVMASWTLHIVMMILSLAIISTDSAVSDSGTYNKKSSALDSDVPLMFPTDPNRYRIITNNSSLLKKFLYHSISNMTNPEIIDMLNIQELKDNPEMSEMDRILKDPVERYSEQIPNKEIPQEHENPKEESELVQEKGADVEKDSLVSHNKHLHIGIDPGNGRISVSKWIAMAVAIILTAGATVYISMLLWKKSLDRRYGSRQILVEDDEVREEYKHSMV